MERIYFVTVEVTNRVDNAVTVIVAIKRSNVNFAISLTVLVVRRCLHRKCVNYDRGAIDCGRIQPSPAAVKVVG